MDPERRIIDLAFCVDGWVFGGYVRDQILGKQAKDIDICFPGTLDKFLRVLTTHYKVEISTNLLCPEGMYMQKGIKRFVRARASGINLDLCDYDGNLEDWRLERTTDFTCNLFYMTGEIALGIRYTPSMYMNKPNPLRHMIDMTKRQEFARIWGYGEVEEKTTRIMLGRMTAMVGRGWTLVNDPMSPKMRQVLDENHPLVWNIYDLQNGLR